MESSKRYNSVPVKDNCTLFASNPIFGPGLSDGVIKISPLPTPVAMATNFGTKLTTTRPLWKKIAPCLHLPPYFGPTLFDSVIQIFSLPTPVAMATNFGTKIDYNSAPTKDNCMLFSLTPSFWARAMQWCHVNFSPENPCCHGNQPFYLKTKLAAGSQERQTLKRSC